MVGVSVVCAGKGSLKTGDGVPGCTSASLEGIVQIKAEDGRGRLKAFGFFNRFAGKQVVIQAAACLELAAQTGGGANQGLPQQVLRRVAGYVAAV